MSFKVISFATTGVTLVGGGGLAIYLSKNSENDTNNPPQ